MKKAIFPGSFDPITNGHLDIIKKASKIFDEIIVVVLLNKNKKAFLHTDTRIQLIKESIKDIKNIKVDTFDGLTVQYAKENNINTLIRSVRNSIDYEYEVQIAQVNREISQAIETIFIAPDLKFNHISSSIVRELYEFNGNYSKMVPQNVFNYLNEIKGERKKCQ